MSIWPFGTSTKDRKRIAALERTVNRLCQDVADITGERPKLIGDDECTVYLTNCYYGKPPLKSLRQLMDALDALERQKREIMAAAGLVYRHQEEKTWIEKKKGAK